MRFENGEVWPIPVVWDVEAPHYAEATRGKGARGIVFKSEDGLVSFTVKDPEVYKWDKGEYCEKIFGTTDVNHPGVRETMAKKDYLLGGEIVDFQGEINNSFSYLTPEQTKAHFRDKGWETVVAFQTRNVPHLGHEYIQKQALEQVDALMIQPVIGRKKDKDFKDEYIIAAYEAILDKHYPVGRTLLNPIHLDMHYAGPREALMHALIRRNFGCTHFIVGRDHAGVGDFYEPYAAQQIFSEFDPKELGIEIMTFNEAAYDSKRKKFAFVDEIAENDRILISGTKVRDGLTRLIDLPEYIIRPEVRLLIKSSLAPLVDEQNMTNNNKEGFVLWFTGLSAAGKSTLADAVYKQLAKRGVKLERFDGDLIREHLTKDLGFSKEDRDENIRRVGFVAGLLSRNNVGVIASFISPYQAQRQELKKNVHNFIEVFVDAPLAVCEERDPKGLYKKARAGQIPNFTGLEDPYEVPEDPDVHVRTDEVGVDGCVEMVIGYLEEREYI